MSTNSKPLASVSLDLDNKWAYLKTHGDPGWETYPSYLEVVVPRFLKFLAERDLRITVFVVGQDAALEQNKASLSSLAEAGHEIGNHSFTHEPWLHLYTPKQLEQEFERSEAAIFAATGQRTIGFRGPGFSLSDQVLQTLMRRGYEYDCSTFPTYLGPLARAYYFMKSRLSDEQKEDRKALFGKFSNGFQSNRPYAWLADTARLIEIPVTTMPLFKVPIHASYLLYLGKFSTTLAKMYYWTALQMCRLSGVQPSMLLHPLDFLGADDEQDLAFFPAMDQPSYKKLQLLSDTIGMLCNNFQVVTMQEHAKSIVSNRMAERSISTATTGVPGEVAEVKEGSLGTSS